MLCLCFCHYMLSPYIIYIWTHHTSTFRLSIIIILYIKYQHQAILLAISISIVLLLYFKVHEHTQGRYISGICFLSILSPQNPQISSSSSSSDSDRNLVLDTTVTGTGTLQLPRSRRSTS